MGPQAGPKNGTKTGFKIGPKLWKFDTLWEHPWVRVKRHATHHRGSSMHRRLVENILLVAGRVCVFDLEVGHNILLVFGLIIL